MASDEECDTNNVTKDENTEETAPQTTEKSGWLWKRTKFSNQWGKKWFSLKERNIFYGDSATDTPKNFTLDLCEVGTCEMKSKSYTFYLKPKDSKRKYFLCAENESELQEWMQAICLARSYGQKNSGGSEACVIQ